MWPDAPLGLTNARTFRPGWSWCPWMGHCGLGALRGLAGRGAETGGAMCSRVSSSAEERRERGMGGTTCFGWSRIFSEEITCLMLFKESGLNVERCQGLQVQAPHSPIRRSLVQRDLFCLHSSFGQI